MSSRNASFASSDRSRRELPAIAARVMGNLERILRAMQRAADQISSGRAVEEIDDSGYQLYLARKDPQNLSSRTEAVLCAMDHDQFYRLLEEAAGEFGLCLEDETRLEVDLPEAEFEENMITGGFEKYRGLAVGHRNQCLEELMMEVCLLLREEGFAVACVPDEDVIFYLPLGEG